MKMQDSLFRRVYEDEILSLFVKEECCENEVAITFDEKIEAEEYIILKVDDFYNSLGLEETPASPDCLIIRKCESGGYALTIVELKHIFQASAFDLENLMEKFRTCFDDFMSVRFKDIFFRDYKDIKLYFVSNIEIYNKRDLGLKFEILLNRRFVFRDKKYMIQPRMPNPTIKKCY